MKEEEKKKKKKKKKKGGVKIKKLFKSDELGSCNGGQKMMGF